ncbi:class I SAM-dependent methyltransferase [Streptomyces sp. NPDC048506]|uniref:SAM-dependent methyltransferase n=1 Tax=Streptomyces sp. NPDC048506 TaxID=3155028 RepID=UPI00341BA8FF
MIALFRSKRSAVYKGSSDKAIRHHYDFLGDFYSLALGPELVYSLALWEEGDTLESAQLRKLDYHVRAARAEGAGRVLDVGCGWGSLMHRLVETHHVGHVVGLNVSAAQVAWIRRRGWPQCEVLLENWIDHEPAAPYDAVFSIEVMEHVAGSTIWRARRVARYRMFFERCRSWLRPGGRLAVQSNVWNERGWLPSMVLPARMLTGPGEPSRGGRFGVRDALGAVRNLREGLHSSRRVFRECFVPTRSELIEASRGLFTVVELRDDAEDGARTMECWLERCLTHRERGAELIGRDAVDDIIREQRATLRFMREHRCTVLRMVLERTA